MHHYAWKIKILSMKRGNLKVTMTLCVLFLASIFQAFLSCLLKISLAMTSMLIRNTHEKLSLFWHVKCLWVLLSYFSYYWQSNRRVCSCVRWVVSVVAWQSSKSAILCWPRFKSRSGHKVYTIFGNTSGTASNVWKRERERERVRERR